MSKFIDAVQSKLFNVQRRNPWPKHLIVTRETGFDPELCVDKIQQQYRIGVSYQIQGYCDPAVLHLIERSFISKLKSEIYDDFRDLLFDLRHALYDADHEKAMQVMDKISNETGLFE